MVSSVLTGLAYFLTFCSIGINMSLLKRLLGAAGLRRWSRNLVVKLVDVGASGGINSRWREIDDSLSIIGLEPDQEAFNSLIEGQSPDSRDIYLCMGLHDHAATLPVFLTHQQVCSSLYEPNIDLLKSFNNWQRFSVEREAEMQVERLDVLLLENSVADVDFVKVDTQGSELHILKGRATI